MTQPSASGKLARIVSWFFGAFIVLMGVFALGRQPFGGLLLLISGGLLLPPVAQRLSDKLANKWRISLAVVLLIVGVGISPAKQPQKSVVTQTPTPQTAPAAQQAVAPKPDQEMLEENLANITSKTPDMSYRGIDIEKSDSDRPQGTKMITVKVTVQSFFSKNSLLRSTGKLSSQLFQAVYSANILNPYDVLVWYYGETTDRYGNKKEDVVLTYAIDKATFAKINWQNIDQAGLCDFLNQEASATNSLNTTCNVLVNIK